MQLEVLQPLNYAACKQRIGYLLSLLPSSEPTSSKDDLSISRLSRSRKLRRDRSSWLTRGSCVELRRRVEGTSLQRNVLVDSC